MEHNNNSGGNDQQIGDTVEQVDNDQQVEGDERGSGEQSEYESVREADDGLKEASSGGELQARIQNLQEEIVRLRDSKKESSSEMSRALAITRAIVPYDPRKQTLEEWRAKFEGRARLLRLHFKELLEFMGLCLTDKAWDTYNRRLVYNPTEEPERTYYGIIAELTKQYSESPKHAFSSLCKLKYKEDIFRHSTEIYRLTKLAFPNMASDARDQICVQVFWKSLPLVPTRVTASEAVTLVGTSFDGPDEDATEESKKEDGENKDVLVTAAAHWPYYAKGKGGKGKGKGWYSNYGYGYQKGYGSRKGYGYSKGKGKGGKGKGKYKRRISEVDNDNEESDIKKLKVIETSVWTDECEVGHPSRYVDVGNKQLSRVRAVLDTGSSTTLISKRVANSIDNNNDNDDDCIVDHNSYIVSLTGNVNVVRYIDVVINNCVALKCPVVNTDGSVIRMNGKDVDILLGMDYCSHYETIVYKNIVKNMSNYHDIIISTKEVAVESVVSEDVHLKHSDFDAIRKHGKWEIAWTWKHEPTERQLRPPFYEQQIEALTTQQRQLFKDEIALWIEKKYIRPCTEQYVQATYTIMPQVQMHKVTTPVRPVLNLKPSNNIIKSFPNEQSDPLACGNTLRKWRCKYGPKTYHRV